MSDELVLSEPEGAIAVPAATLARIVARAAERVDGTRVRRPRRSVDVDVAGGSATVSVRLMADHGAVLPALAEAVQREIADALAAMCELEVRQVDVAIEELA
jgi:uncharacterized alkaline shock family protein YloU